MRRLALALTLTLATAAPAFAVSLSDLVGLSRAGLSDDILIALVESEKSVFRLEARDLIALKEQGLSDRLILHLLLTPALRDEAARQEAFERQHLEVTSAPPAFAPPQEAEVVVVDRVERVAVPIYVPVYVAPAPPPKAGKPVYWGWGGKRRPDSWKQRR